ncbi:hypothetical protein [Sphingobacterium bovistauri]|uniref:Uncharacterized protein n=1 Tax=Sphingobacterium bovistauri TaxID=2781959 RepID=A0ABS7Z1K0_9SPHI|nr:hypothetical protein [Sphingobacterium bovistauri]MCA5004042.1 hypothetical protein [Sphingobacterium bovistauri]
MLKLNVLYLFLFHFILLSHTLFAQAVLKINDKHIINQQERMVYKQWDKDKFTPKKGFLSLNPQYWITWGLHPNYPKTDRRPLSPTGPQTLRMGMLLAMKESTDKYKHHSDTLSTTALTEIYNYTPQASTFDPLWNLYYKSELSPLLQEHIDPLKDFPEDLKRSLINKGVVDWYLEEFESLIQRLRIARGVFLDRGKRILSYHQILKEFRLLQNNWKAKVQYQTKYILLSKRLHTTEKSISFRTPQIPTAQTDIQIANKILMRIYTQ